MHVHMIVISGTGNRMSRQQDVQIVAELLDELPQLEVLFLAGD